jgi:hypothetical protein
MLLLAVFVACFAMLSPIPPQLVSWLVNGVERIVKEGIALQIYYFGVCLEVCCCAFGIQSERRPNTSLSEHTIVFRSFTSCSIVGFDISEEWADFVFRFTQFGSAGFLGGAMLHGVVLNQAHGSLNVLIVIVTLASTTASTWTKFSYAEDGSSTFLRNVRSNFLLFTLWNPICSWKLDENVSLRVIPLR